MEAHFVVRPASTLLVQDNLVQARDPIVYRSQDGLLHLEPPIIVPRRPVGVSHDGLPRVGEEGARSSGKTLAGDAVSDEGDQGDDKDEDAQDEDLRGGEREKHAGQPFMEGWDEW